SSSAEDKTRLVSAGRRRTLTRDYYRRTCSLARSILQSKRARLPVLRGRNNVVMNHHAKSKKAKSPLS
ncbi:MAG: hypothetical protein ACE5PV_22745, partial [Candidatus Poribacteria bacterium]